MISSPVSPTLSDVRRALALDPFDVLSAWLKMAPLPRPLDRPDDKPGSARPAGVLLLLYPHQDQLTFALTQRTDDVAHHKGQISLPGGAVEDGETPARASLRETCEEIQVCLEEEALIGSLTPLYVIVSDFVIHPFIGYTQRQPEFHPQPGEVQRVIETPLRTLFDESHKETERRTLLRGIEADVPFYRIDGEVVWGATAIILSELEWRLRAVLSA
jgi:8-oxo-dGTP pyrophosphatase MutT (NUDIX family)